MPTFQYEAMDHTGKEVKDTIDAATQEEAQQLIRQKGFFVTKISEKAAKAKNRQKAARPRRRGPAGGRRRSRSPSARSRPSSSAPSPGSSPPCRTPACRSSAA